MFLLGAVGGLTVMYILQQPGGEKAAARSERNGKSLPPPLSLLSQFAFTQHDVHSLLHLSAQVSRVLGKRAAQNSR